MQILVLGGSASLCSKRQPQAIKRRQGFNHYQEGTSEWVIFRRLYSPLLRYTKCTNKTRMYMRRDAPIQDLKATPDTKQ